MTKTKDVELILKPRGRRSRDFKIIEAMQADGKVEVSRTTYKNLIVSRPGWSCSLDCVNLQPQSYVRFAVDVSLDKELPFKDQEMADLVKVIASVCQISCCIAIMMVSNILSIFHKVKANYPFIEKYHNAWPVNMLIQQYLNNHRNNLRAKAAADEGTPDQDVDPGVAGPSTVTPTAGPNNDDDDDDDGSDVTISDIDD
jgi:hypothetical protein